MKPACPQWAHINPRDGFVEIDPDVAYPIALELLGMRADQYSLEVARRCLTHALKDALGPPLNIRILPRDRWRLVRHPEGSGQAAAGQEFRAHYRRVKTALIGAAR